MRKLLLLMFALLTSVSGAWAASPAAGAYPVEGKTYYLFGNKYNSTDRYYLYWDNTNSVLKNAENSKENNDYYKWTVTISDGKYYITNVGTSTKLAWDGSKGLTLNATGTLFDLSKQVHYTACVSLYNPSGFWCCVQNSSETFASGLKFSSFPSDTYSASYSLDFVFEEVLSAHSLTDGSYYTIYCDNDNKQYMYDNAGTLAQTNSAPASDLRYVWQCIVNGEYYNFRNVQSGKYLSHKAISTSANDFSVETADIYHDGCVKLKTKDGNYMGWKTNGTVDQASHPRFPKVTTDYSFDYRFDAVDMSAWCVGDKLGGTMSDGDWKSSWTSGTTPSFTMTASAANINNTSGSYTGGLDIRSGKDVLRSTYTLTAPDGYFITGYKLVGKALNGDQTVTPAGGTATVFTSNGNSMSVSGLNTQQTSFTLTGANNGLFLHAMQVDLTPISSIASLPTANNKAYIVVADRGTWNFADNATSMGVSSVADLDNTNEHIALIYKDQNYYLYSVHAGKYLTADNTLTALPSDNEQVSITATGNTTYPWFFRFKNLKDGNDKYTKNINISNGTIKIDGWGPDGSNTSGSLDEGNRVAILEADDFDATAALAMFDQLNITYNLSYGGNTLRTESNVTTYIGGSAEKFIPSSFVVPGVTYSYEPETIGASTTEVTVTASWTNDIFHISTAGNELWYAVDMHSNQNNYTWQYDAETGEVQTPVIAKDAYYNITDNNLFCFMGNPWDGFKIYNKAAGSSKTLRKATTGNTVSYMSDTDDHNLFKLYASRAISNAYCFKLDGDDYYLNKQNLKLQGWNDNDAGSSCRFFTPGSFYVNFINTLNLDAPLGAVGTKSSITHQEQIETLEGMKWLFVGNPFVVLADASFASYLNPIRNSETIALGTGYWRLVSAYPGYVEKQKKRPAIYYNSDNDQLRWSIDGLTTDYQVNSVIQLGAGSADGKYTIYSPNAQKFLYTTATEQSQNLGTLGATGSDITFTSLGSAQHQIFVSGNENGLHTNEHSEGAGTGNTIVSWNGGANTASAWYIVKANELDITLNDGGDDYYYATMCLPFDVTLSAACAYTLTLNGEYLTLAEAISAVPAGTPVLLRHTANSVKATIAHDASTAAPLATTALTGSYKPTAVDGEGLVNSQRVYTLGSVGGQIGFYWYNGTSIGANKAYLLTNALVSSTVRGFTFNFTDGISSIASQTGDNTAIYDMQGRRVNNATRGLYIQNGKKILK